MSITKDQANAMSRRGREWKLTGKEYDAYKQGQIDYFAQRWQHLPPGLDRMIQADALLCILEERPVTFNVMTIQEMDRHITEELARCQLL